MTNHNPTGVITKLLIPFTVTFASGQDEFLDYVSLVDEPKNLQIVDTRRYISPTDNVTNMNNTELSENDKLEIILSFADRMIEEEVTVPEKYLDYIDDNLSELIC